MNMLVNNITYEATAENSWKLLRQKNAQKIFSKKQGINMRSKPVKQKPSKNVATCSTKKCIELLQKDN